MIIWNHVTIKTRKISVDNGRIEIVCWFKQTTWFLFFIPVFRKFDFIKAVED